MVGHKLMLANNSSVFSWRCTRCNRSNLIGCVQAAEVSHQAETDSGQEDGKNPKQGGAEKVGIAESFGLVAEDVHLDDGGSVVDDMQDGGEQYAVCLVVDDGKDAADDGGKGYLDGIAVNQSECQ